MTYKELKIENTTLKTDIAKLNSDIEAMFIFSFSKGYQIGSEKAVEAITDNSIGALNSGLFPDLAKMSMREYFSKVNPPSLRLTGEKEN